MPLPFTSAAFARRAGASFALACSLAAARAQPPQPIVLPPFLVESRSAPDWLYGREPGFEVLSRCSVDTTRRVLSSVWHARALFDRMLDGHFQVRRSLPVVVILCPEEWKPALPPAAAELLHLPAGPRRGWFAPAVQFFPNLYLGSSDLQVVFFVEPGRVTRYPDALTPAAAERELKDWLPPLPPWFVAGFAAHYGRAQWVAGDPPPDAGFRLSPDDDDTPRRLIAEPAEWVSQSETDSFRHDADRPRWLLPLPELLAAAAPADPERSRVWRSESELFVRWLLSRVPHGRDALWRLADAGARAPMTEATFQRIVGYNYSDAFDALSDFLPEAVTTDFAFPTGDLPDPPASTLRFAKPAEITRLKAAWEEAEVEYIRPRYPVLVKTYAEQAEATLDWGRHSGPDTPAALALRGLLALDQGDATGARIYLEAAVRAQVMRPLAYTELAALRLREAQAHPLGHGGRLSGPQARFVLEPLWAGRSQEPQPLAGFLVAAKAAALCAYDPGGHFADYLALGRSLYPLNGPLDRYSRK